MLSRRSFLAGIAAALVVAPERRRVYSFMPALWMPPPPPPLAEGAVVWIPDRECVYVLQINGVDTEIRVTVDAGQTVAIGSKDLLTVRRVA